MRVRSFLVLSLCAALSFIAGYGQAIPFSFSGSVTQINTDPADPFGGAFELGTPFTGSFVFDSGAVDAVADVSTGSYLSSGAEFRTILIIGDPATTGAILMVNETLHVGVANDYPGSVDQYTVLAQNADGSMVIELFLENPSGAAFSSDALPLTPPSLLSFTTARLTFTGLNIDGNYVEIIGNISSLALLPPTIASIVPGAAQPGDEITIHGSGYIGNVQVFFNGAPIDPSAVQVIDENTLIVTIPPLPEGQIEVTVTTPGGSVTAPPWAFAIGDAIPTLSQWSLLLLLAALSTIGVIALRSRRNLVG